MVFNSVECWNQSAGLDLIAKMIAKFVFKLFSI
jgi:hypothetical protein